MEKEEFEFYHYTNLPIKLQSYDYKRIILRGCIMFNEIYTFSIVIVDGDDRHFIYLSMTSPEILCKNDSYNLTKDNIEELMDILTNHDGWNKLIESMKNCIVSDELTDDYIKIDFSKIPDKPIDYSSLINKGED